MTSWKTVRVFISSTFRDMQAERDHLVRFVFPRLREELLLRRILLVDVDLRWGVTSEQDASEVCREIINECRPRFLCMLGGRYGWVPPGKTRSITADEVHYGVLDQTLKDRGFAYFYFRDDAATTAIVETTPGEFSEQQGSDNQNKLAELKQAIIAASLNPVTYSAQWDNERRRLTGLKKFGDRVHDDLLDSMKSDPVLRDRFVTETAAQPDEFDEENAAMEAFVEERSERFVLGSREAVLDQLLAHTSATSGNGYICLIGAPGSGKSALLAQLSRHSSLNDQLSTLLIRHFVGASAGSTDVRRTLRRLCHELKAGCPDITADTPDDPEKLRVAFPDFLRQACAQKRVVILLDAVNQLDPASHSAGLHWLPDELPDNARVILSALDGPALEELRRRPRKPHEIELKPLTPDDGEAIIEQFRERYRKEFESDQIELLLGKDESGELNKTDSDKPLYLLAALEELRTLGTYEEITRRIAELPATTHELFTWILERLENDDGFRDESGRQVGRELVSRFAALLGASRHGLSQRELADLLDAGDPQGNVAALLHLLRPYLMRRGELLDFYHGQFRAAAADVCLKMDAQGQAAHQQLADYFVGCAKGSDPAREWETDGVRGFAECVFQLAKAGQHDRAAGLLTNFVFLRHKTRVGLLEGLFDDYDILRHEAPTEVGNRLDLKNIDSFLHRYAGPLRSYGSREEMFLQCAQLFFSASPDFAGEIARLDALAASAWLRTKIMSRLPSSSESSDTRVTELAGHDGWINLCVLLRNGRSGVTASCEDHTIRFWDLASGKCICIYQAETRAMTRSHLSGVLARIGDSVHHIELTHGKSADIPPEDRDVASILEDPPSRYDITLDGSLTAHVSGRTVTVRKPGSGSIQAQVDADREVVAVAISEDGGIVAFSEDSPRFDSNDYRITVWDTVNRRAVMVIESKFIFGVAKLVAVGRYLVTQTGRWLRVYDTAQQLCVFEESFPIAYGLDALFVEGVLTILLGCNDCVARSVELPEANMRPIQATSTNAKPSSAPQNKLFELSPTGFLDKVAFATGDFSSMLGIGSYIAHTLYEDGTYDSHYDSPLHLKMFSDRKEYVTGEIKHLLGFVVTSQTGELIVAGDVDGLVHVWEAAMPIKAALELELDIDHPCGGAFLPGERAILIAGHHEMRIYKFPSFEVLRSVNAPNHLGFLTLTLAQHGRIAATANGDEVTIWSVSDFRMLGTAAVARGKFEDGIRFCSFDATGEILAAASSSGTVYFYNSADCRILGTRQLNGECIDLVWCWEYLCALTADGYAHLFNPRTLDLEILYCEKLFVPHCIGRIGADLCCMGSNSEIVLVGRAGSLPSSLRNKS